MDPGRTAIGTWSGGRFMHFGEPLDDERLAALLRPGVPGLMQPYPGQFIHVNVESVTPR